MSSASHKKNKSFFTNENSSSSSSSFSHSPPSRSPNNPTQLLQRRSSIKMKVNEDERDENLDKPSVSLQKKSKETVSPAVGEEDDIEMNELEDDSSQVNSTSIQSYASSLGAASEEGSSSR